ncbi:MAG: hypothetical protein ACOCRK_11930 [bacterium]
MLLDGKKISFDRVNNEQSILLIPDFWEDGEYELDIRARDITSNVKDLFEKKFILDSTIEDDIPTATIVIPDSGIEVIGEITLEYEISDDVTEI